MSFTTMTSIQSGPLVPRPILVPFVETVAFLIGNVIEKSGRDVRTKLDGLGFIVIKQSDVQDEAKVRKLLSEFLPRIAVEKCSLRIWKQADIIDAFKESHPSYSAILTME